MENMTVRLKMISAIWTFLQEPTQFRATRGDSDAESESDPGETDRDEDRAETSGEERGDPKMVWINEGQQWV